MARKPRARQRNRRITIRRAVTTNTGLGTTESWADLCTVFASREDVSDAERAAAGTEVATLRSRFVIRKTSLVADVGPADSIAHAGLVFDILGVKEVDGMGLYLEITAEAKLKGAS